MAGLCSVSVRAGLLLPLGQADGAAEPKGPDITSTTSSTLQGVSTGGKKGKTP